MRPSRARPGPADAVAAVLRTAAHAERHRRVEDPQIAHVDALEPRGQGRIEQEPLAAQLGLHTEERA
jgi:hypothetical protein